MFRKEKRNLRRNFGVDYPIQNKKSTTNEKILVEKYGVDNISKKKNKIKK
jgi:hypothetical protein